MDNQNQKELELDIQELTRIMKSLEDQNYSSAFFFLNLFTERQKQLLSNMKKNYALSKLK